MDDQHSPLRRQIFIDPSYRVFNSDGLFDLNDPLLNRDGQLLPFYRLRESMFNRGVVVRTADYLINDCSQDEYQIDYYSLGVIDNFEKILMHGCVRMAAFIIMEPPVVAPELYAALPRLTEVFDKVYVHNTHGDGYSLEGVNTSKLQKLYYPIPYKDVLSPYWENIDREKRIVVINGIHKPRARDRELYSSRIRAMAELSKFGVIDLYGRGWNRWWSRSAMWFPYWINFPALMSIYKGGCASKFAVLQNYDFCLCFENMRMDGYITEKIFDCLYAGAIPLYLGAPDIIKYIPEDVFVDCQKYSTWKEMWEDIFSMSNENIGAMKMAGQRFLKSAKAMPFFHSVDHICEV